MPAWSWFWILMQPPVVLQGFYRGSICPDDESSFFIDLLS
jgi:hypothetical protein